MAQTKRLSVPYTDSAPVVKGKARKRIFSYENPWVWLAPATLILLAYSIVPLVYNVVVSFQEWSTTKKIFIPKELENWQRLLTQDARFGNALVITLQYTLIALVIQLSFGLLIALLLDSKPWGGGIMQTIMILPMVVAPAVAGLIFRLLEHSEYGAISWLLYTTGLLTKEQPLLGGSGQYALIALLLVDIWQWTPFFTLIILAGLKGISGELLEAAQVDGATWWDRLMRIKIPLLFGVMSIGILFRLVDLYKTFDYVVIMTSGGPAGRTEMISYYGYVNSFQLIKWGYGAAIGVFIMLLGWVTAFIYQRAFRVRW